MKKFLFALGFIGTIFNFWLWMNGFTTISRWLTTILDLYIAILFLWIGLGYLKPHLKPTWKIPAFFACWAAFKLLYMVQYFGWIHLIELLFIIGFTLFTLAGSIAWKIKEKQP